MAMVAAMNKVITPTTAITSRTSGTNIGKNLPVRNTPAATIVAEWTSADTGVGPSIASGNQTCNGN